MKLFHLDNEYSDYIVLAQDEDEAWKKLEVQVGILPFGVDDPDGLLDEAYHDIIEVVEDYFIDHTDGMCFIL